MVEAHPGHPTALELDAGVRVEGAVGVGRVLVAGDGAADRVDDEHEVMAGRGGPDAVQHRHERGAARRRVQRRKIGQERVAQAREVGTPVAHVVKPFEHVVQGHLVVEVDDGHGLVAGRELRGDRQHEQRLAELVARVEGVAAAAGEHVGVDPLGLAVLALPGGGPVEERRRRGRRRRGRILERRRDRLAKARGPLPVAFGELGQRRLAGP